MLVTMWPNEALAAIKMAHDLAAAALVGGVFFNYYLLRPTLKRIPPPQQAIVATRIGHLFVYLAYGSLAVLFISGFLRLYQLGTLDLENGVGGFFDSVFFTSHFWTTKYARWLLVMIAGWTVAIIDATILTFITRPVLLKRLTLIPRPTPSGMQDRRENQVKVAEWLERVVLINVIVTTTAAIAGASLVYGGWI